MPVRCGLGTRRHVGVDRCAHAAGLVGVAHEVEHERHGRNRRGGVGLALARDVGGGAVHGFEHGGVLARGVEVARRAQADAAGDGSGLVGEDVAEQVVGDDDVEARGVGDHVDGGGVDVAVVDGHIRVLLPHLVDDAAPHVAGIDQHVVLVDQGEVLLARGCGFEGVAHDAFDSVGGVDADLGGDLVRCSHAHGAAVAAVEALGALAHDDEVDVAGVGQGAGHAFVVLGGAQVHVVVEGEAQLEEEAAFEDAGGDGGVADRAEEDDVVAFDGLEVLVGEGVAGGVPARRPQVEVSR